MTFRVGCRATAHIASSGGNQLVWRVRISRAQPMPLGGGAAPLAAGRGSATPAADKSLRGRGSSACGAPSFVGRTPLCRWRATTDHRVPIFEKWVAESLRVRRTSRRHSVGSKRELAPRSVNGERWVRTSLRSGQRRIGVKADRKANCAGKSVLEDEQWEDRQWEISNGTPRLGHPFWETGAGRSANVTQVPGATHHTCQHRVCVVRL